MMFNLAGKVACIVGGAGYLGSAVCRGFLDQGAKIIIGDINKSRLPELNDELVQEFPGKSIETYFINIANPEDIEKFMTHISQTYGKIDILVNAAFSAVGKYFTDVTEGEFNRANAINITAAYSLLKHSLPHIENGGSIILFSSMYGIIPPNPNDYPGSLLPNPIEYGVGKSAVNQITKYFAAFCGKRTIRVNAIAPGAFPWNREHTQNKMFMKRLSEKSMLDRVGEQYEIAGPVVFLASDEASYITGQVISVDGGVTAW